MAQPISYEDTPVPASIRKAPSGTAGRIRKIIGDLSNSERVLS